MGRLGKPKTVDSVGWFHEVYDELKEHKRGVILFAILNFFLSVFLSGLTQMWVNNVVHSLNPKVAPHHYSGIKGMLRFAIFKWWWLAIIFYLLGCVFAFRIFRMYRKTYEKNYDDNYLKSKHETYGGAHFQTKEELEEHFNIYEDIEDTDEDIYGMDDDGEVYAMKPGQLSNENHLYLGSPGSGKSAAIVKTKIYQGLRRGESMIVTDTKGDLYRRTVSVAHKVGYNVRVLNLKTTELKNSDGWDLFRSLNPKSDGFDADVQSIVDIIFANTAGDKEMEDYWYKNEMNLIKAITMHVASDPIYAKANRNHFPEIYNIVATATPESLRAMMAKYERVTDSVIWKCYSNFSSAKSEVQGQIINGAAIRLQKLANPILQKVLSSDEIDTTLPMKESCIYYVIIPDQDNVYKFVSALFFAQLMSDLCLYNDALPEQERKNQHFVRFVMDEYTATGGIKNLRKIITTVRSRGIGLDIILQSSQQLNTMYEDSEVVDIKNACVVKAMLACNDYDTAEEYSKLLGAQTIVVENQRYLEDSADITHAHGTIQFTMGEGTRPLLLPEEIYNGKVSRDEILYVINGMQPVRLKKYFSEKAGKLIHPMEQWAAELGERIPAKHLPKWRYLEIEEEKRRILEEQRMEEEMKAKEAKAKEQVKNEEAKEAAMAAADARNQETTSDANSYSQAEEITTPQDFEFPEIDIPEIDAPKFEDAEMESPEEFIPADKPKQQPTVQGGKKEDKPKEKNKNAYDPRKPRVKGVDEERKFSMGSFDFFD